MLDSVATNPQNSPAGGSEDVTDAVVGDLQARKEAGMRKYGQPLRTFNGRDALMDAYQESMDLTVYLRQKLGEQQQQEIPDVPIAVTDKITVRCVQKMGGDHMVVAAARVSTIGEEALQFSDPSRAGECAGLINYLIKHRHGTPFEHASMTFFVHAPIFVWREWHRHRIGFSYNEESARYKQLNPLFWMPREDRKIVPAVDHTSARPHFVEGDVRQASYLRGVLLNSYRQSYSAYAHLISKGYAKEVARAVLPVAIYSSCWVTCNPRSLMSFLSLRTHEPAARFISYPQAEIEEAARAAEQIFADGWPMTYAAFCENGRVAP